MESKAQTAAINAIGKKLNDLLSAFRALQWYQDDAGGYEISPPKTGLDELERLALDAIKEFEILATDYALDPKLAADAKQKALHGLYEEAGKRKEYLWQAAFATRHQLE